MIEKDKERTSRADEQRVSKEAKKVWKQPSSLDAPPAPKGYAHRWIRTSVQGFEDTSNVSRKLREGWEFVRADTIISELGKNDYPTISEGAHQGLIGIGGLVLGRIPLEILLLFSNPFLCDDNPGVPNNILCKVA